MDANLLDKRDLAVRLISDPKFYLENFTKIKGKEAGGLIPFKLTEAQKDMFNALKTHSRIISLKARQIGISTAMVGWLYHKTITTPASNTAIIGYNAELTAELLDKVKTFWATTPDELKPKLKYNSKFEIAFEDLDSKIILLPSSEYAGRGYTIQNCLCLAKGTGVVMSDYTVKPIEAVNIGDVVINGKGGESVVRNVDSKDMEGDMVRVTAYGVPNLVLTDDHEVLVRERLTGRAFWKKAESLVKGDYLAYPYFQCRNRRGFVRLDDGTEKYESRSNGSGEKIETNRDFGTFLGWYLAEGNTNGTSSIMLSIHEDEINEVLGVIEPIKNIIGDKVRISVRKGSKSAQIIIYSKILAKWLSDNFGSNSWDKHLPRMVWNCGWDFAYGLLDGLFLGDGYLNDPLSVSFCTVSPRLAHQVKKLIVSLRLGLPSVRKSETSRYGVKTRDRYDVSLGGKGNYKFRRKMGYELPKYDNWSARWRLKNKPWMNQGGGYWMRGKEYYWSRISSVGRVPYSDRVYDIGLEGEPHSFLTESGVVKNCTELSFWQDADEKISSLEASVPLTGKLIIESSPSAIGSFFHKTWTTNEAYCKKEYGWWWHYTQKEIEVIRDRMNDPLKFAREYELQFDSTGMNVFDRDTIARQRRHNLTIGDKVDMGEGREPWTVRTIDGWTVYRPPEEGHAYVLSADIAEGIVGGNWSVAVVFDRHTGEEVAFYRAHVAPDVFGDVLDSMGRRYNFALTAPEVNNHGLTTLTVLKQKCYPNLYWRPASFDKMVGMDLSDRLGWKTTTVTRPILIDDLAVACREDSIKIRSRIILDEMQVFVYDKNMRPQAEKGFQDDTIIAAGIAVQAFKLVSTADTSQLDYTRYMPKSFSY